jgi:hypothetical protein
METKIRFKDGKAIIIVSHKNGSSISLDKDEICTLMQIINDKKAIEFANWERETGLRVLFKNDQYSFSEPSKNNETLFTCTDFEVAKAFIKGYIKSKSTTCFFKFVWGFMGNYHD